MLESRFFVPVDVGDKRQGDAGAERHDQSGGEQHREVDRERAQQCAGGEDHDGMMNRVLVANLRTMNGELEIDTDSKSR